MSNDNNKTVDEILNEAYEEVLNEGLWDRFKSSAKGMAHSVGNVPKKVGNVAKQAGNIAKAGVGAAAQAATGDKSFGNMAKQGVKGAADARNANANMQTGHQYKNEALAETHKEKLNKFAEDTTRTVKELVADALNDFAKQDPKVAAQYEADYRKAITPSIRTLIRELQAAYTSKQAQQKLKP